MLIMLLPFIFAGALAAQLNSPVPAALPTPSTNPIQALQKQENTTSENLEKLKKEVTKINNDLLSEIHSLQERIARTEQKLQITAPLSSAIKK